MSFFKNLLGSRRKKAAKFWEWFQANAHRFPAVPDGNSPIFSETAARLRKVHHDLVFEVGKGEFVVSADGIKSVFSDVLELVNAAPKVEGWKVIAFRQPTPGVTLEIGDIQLSSGSVRFLSHSSVAPYDVTLYVDGLSAENRDAVVGATFILLDTVLGEFHVATRLGHLEFESLVAAPSGHRPLSELRDVAGI